MTKAPKRIERQADWLSRLESYVARTEREPFVWGTQDCGLWASGAIRAMTGHDPAASFRGSYTSRQEAEAALKAKGFPDHFAMASSLFEECAPGLAEVGDLVRLEGRTLGIIQGRFAWAMGERGLARVSMNHAETAWRIPFAG